MAQFLPHLFGQDKVKTELQQSLEKQRLPHTMIFYGDEGLGKTTAALDLASYMVGHGQNIWDNYHEWNTDESYLKIPVLTSADDQLWYIRPMGMELKIEQFLFFLDAMASFDSKTHICVIDEAQTMGGPVANSMLKTLEEPPANMYFILITHDLDALLPTIISRAEKFAFFPLKEADFEAFYTSIDSSVSPDDIDMMYQLTGGNPGLLKRLTADGGDAQPDAAMVFWETITADEIPLSKLYKEWKNGDDCLVMLRWISMVGRDILIETGAPGSDFGRCKTISERVRKVARAWDPYSMEQAMEVLGVAQQAVRRYISTKNIWDMVILRLCRIRKGKV